MKTYLALIAAFPFNLFFSAPADVPANVPEQPLRGIYFTSQTAGNAKGEDLAKEFAAKGGTMIIFDVQDSKGHLAYESNLPQSIEMGNRKNQIPDIHGVVRKLQDHGFYVVARLVMFKNPFLANKKPQWTLKRRGALLGGTSGTFVSRDGPVWLDPGNSELREYLINTGRELALAGFDEIQFDYVRFPEGGKGVGSPYTFTGEDKFTRDQVLTDFVAKASDALHLFGVKVSVDVFGIVVWDNVSWKVIGQNVAELAKHVDAIYPMPYPSHFGYGWGGHKNPANEPYFFVQETTKKFVEQTAGTGVKIRPWLQGFMMKVTNYGPSYIREQIRALKDINIGDYAVWNAANEYGIVFKGL